MTTAPYSNLIGFQGGFNGGNISQDEKGNWNWTSTDSEGNTRTSDLKDQMTADQWDQFQKEANQGFFEQNKGTTIVSNQAPSVMGMAPNQLRDAFNMGQGYAGLGSDQQAGPMTQNLRVPGATQWDPNYGWITPQRNFAKHTDLAEILVPAIIGAGAGFAGMPGLGNLFGGAFQQLSSGSLNPISLGMSALGAFGGSLGLPSLGSLGLPSAVTSALPMVLQLAQSGKINPIQLAMYLAKQGQR